MADAKLSNDEAFGQMVRAVILGTGIQGDEPVEISYLRSLGKFIEVEGQYQGTPPLPPKVPFIERKHPSIRGLLEKKPGKGNPAIGKRGIMAWTFHGRCVDQILNAFLRHLGIDPEGSKRPKIDLRNHRRPK